MTVRKGWPDNDDLVQLVSLAEKMGRCAPLVGSAPQDTARDNLIRALAGVVSSGSEIIHERRWVASHE